MWLFRNRKRYKKKEIVTYIEDTDFIVIKDDLYKKQDEDDDDQQHGIIKTLVAVIDRLTKPKKSKPIFVLTTIINNQTLIMADISLNVGQLVGGNMALIDNVTGNPVPATFSNQAVASNSNPEFADFFVNTTDPNRINGNGIAVGSGQVVITADGSYIDPGDGSAQSASFSVTKNFTVTSVSGPNGVTFDVVFP